MRTSEDIKDIAKAMSEAQRVMKPAVKDSLNPHFKSKYSDISSVWESIRDPLTNQGLTVWQDVTTEERQVSITTRIVHISGQWVEFGPLSVPMSKADAHGVGSAISYAKRYALCAAVGVVSGDEDDDGNAAKQEHVQPKQPPYVKITSDKIVELNQLFEKCSPDFYRSLMDKIKKVYSHISTIADFNDAIYAGVKDKINQELERMRIENESST